ncbi:MgtC/SapB family protein [Acidobacterium sp. S8]|uniref:MgtC/SapB family protein n=1 Tax=Acidobacterium sp. S8 TaxID=1641854 RepID=UPI00131EA5E7|nr:MgtC/SapB family protein [Acidobacterium sp. S8]
MPVEITWQTIAIRIVITLLAGALLGTNRSKHGNPAGLRTTMLVALAASIAMIQMNLLLPTNGKPHDSYAVMDLMRLPLGILTGVGFIGAGAILRKDNLVIGVTTAATMWFATVVGLCLGGGQIILGSVAAVLGFIILSTLHWLETRIEEQQQATLCLTLSDDGISETELRRLLESARIAVRSVSVKHQMQTHLKKFELEVRWPAHKDSKKNPGVLNDIAQLPGLIEMEWVPAGTST